MAKKKDVRVAVILECTSCIRNSVNKVPTGISIYITQKNLHNTPNRLELSKFCPYCYKHIIHGEIKKIDRMQYVLSLKGIKYVIYII